MKCEEVQRKLSAFQDNELNEEAADRIREHLSRCRACAEDLQAISSVWDFVRTTDELDPSPYFWTRLSAKIARQGEHKGFRSSLWRRLIANPIPAFAAAALVLGLLFGNFVGRTLYPDGYQANGEATAEALALNSFDDMPSGSLSEVYYSLLTEGGEQ